MSKCLEDDVQSLLSGFQKPVRSILTWASGCLEEGPARSLLASALAGRQGVFFSSDSAEAVPGEGSNGASHGLSATVSLFKNVLSLCLRISQVVLWVFKFFFVVLRLVVQGCFQYFAHQPIDAPPRRSRTV